MSVVLGIDFGTSYSTAGAYVGGRVELVPDEGDPMIPSLVHLAARGPAVIGRRAMPFAMSDPTATIASIKRVLAAGADPDAVDVLAAGLPYRLKVSGANVMISARGRDYPTVQVAAEILARLRDLAENRFGGRISRAVFTIPVSAPPAYIESLKRAAKIAHLEVAQVVAEPIAGALALGLHGDPATRRVVVCDFGGGTFDVTAIAQDGRKFTPVATGGDLQLGGDDLDLAMASAIGGLIYKRARFEILNDQVRRTHLLQRCESTKRMLSEAPQAPLVMRDAYIEDSEYRSLNLMIERAWIEPIWRPLVERAIACTRRTIRAARWAPEDVDLVVLIGGGSMVPSFRAGIAEVVPEERISTSPLAGTAVAMGAALLTARHTGTAQIPVLDLAQVPRMASPADDGIPIDIGP